MATELNGRFRVGVDIGGTFTDLIVVDDHSGELTVGKVLTTPGDPSQAVEAVLARLVSSGRVKLPAKQRAPYTVVGVESDRVGPSGTDQDRVRPATSRTDSPPLGGSPTHPRRSPRPKAESDRREPRRRRARADGSGGAPTV